MVDRGGKLLVDAHYANRLESYLRSFAHVTIACPQLHGTQNNLVEISCIPGHERTQVYLLPEPYREDRYFRHRSQVAKLIKAEIAQAELILIAPHSAFDWPTLAGLIALKLGRKYGMEADWDLQSVWRENIRAMPLGLQKVRHLLWLQGHSRPYRRLLRGSSLALLEGATVFDAYRELAPNPQQVLNVQITDDDRASSAELRAKQQSLRSVRPLRVAYTGRLVSMKGPEDWIFVLSDLDRRGIHFEATWLGDGPLAPSIRKMVREAGLGEKVFLPGAVPREEARKVVEQSDIFLFCHKTQESPRCLLEALALGTPIIGYDSLHARHLTAASGGSCLVRINDTATLVSTVERLAGDRAQLARMMADAHRSSMAFDRDEAVKRRIDLIKLHLEPLRSTSSKEVAKSPPPAG
jgi:glycosyltransferase involved in cell wall biosynthesis